LVRDLINEFLKTGEDLKSNLQRQKKRKKTELLLAILGVKK
jgi:hypothetical protein